MKIVEVAGLYDVDPGFSCNVNSTLNHHGYDPDDCWDVGAPPSVRSLLRRLPKEDRTPHAVAAWVAARLDSHVYEGDLPTPVPELVGEAMEWCVVGWDFGEEEGE